MLGVDERRHAAELLRLGDDLQRQRGLAGRLRPEDLDDAAARHAADAERVVDADGAGGNGVDRLDGAFLAEAHDRALAELLLDLADGQFDGFQAPSRDRPFVCSFHGGIDPSTVRLRCPGVHGRVLSEARLF